eukprot:m51a1_g5419 hypothetical protein (452) ;mRNA; f:130707-132314
MRTRRIPPTACPFGLCVCALAVLALLPSRSAATCGAWPRGNATLVPAPPYRPGLCASDANASGSSVEVVVALAPPSVPFLYTGVCISASTPPGTSVEVVAYADVGGVPSPTPFFVQSFQAVPSGSYDLELADGIAAPSRRLHIGFRIASACAALGFYAANASDAGSGAAWHWRPIVGSEASWRGPGELSLSNASSVMMLVSGRPRATPGRGAVAIAVASSVGGAVGFAGTVAAVVVVRRWKARQRERNAPTNFPTEVGSVHFEAVVDDSSSFGPRSSLSSRAGDPVPVLPPPSSGRLSSPPAAAAAAPSGAERTPSGRSSKSLRFSDEVDKFYPFSANSPAKAVMLPPIPIGASGTAVAEDEAAFEPLTAWPPPIARQLFDEREATGTEWTEVEPDAPTPRNASDGGASQQSQAHTATTMTAIELDVFTSPPPAFFDRTPRDERITTSSQA